MADAPLLAMDVLQWARHHRSFPGQGDFDVVGFFEQVLRAGYTGPLSLEIFNDIFRETPNRRTAVDAMRSLLYLESEARERMASATEAPAPAQPQCVELFNPPPVPALSGLSFIEFAADEASAPTLAHAGRQLGFRRIGTHRSKAVTLYRQGDINLIVNAQPDSFARGASTRTAPRCARWACAATTRSRPWAAPPPCARSGTTARSARTSCACRPSWRRAAT
jgi:4-hydroxyphenylpyruvate dioxygenase